MEPSPKSSSSSTALGANSTKRNLLREALQSDVSQFCWCVLIAEEVTDILDAIAVHMTVEEREEILAKMILARSVWTCKKCSAFSLEAILAGYKECSFCTHWYHAKCLTESDDVVGEDVDDEATFVCETCVALREQNDPQTAAVISKDTLVILPDSSGIYAEGSSVNIVEML